MPVHNFDNKNGYFLGVFFVGAYQETLGDLHNLFGDTNVITIKLLSNGNFKIIHEQLGDKVSEVLSYVEYSTKKLFKNFEKTVNTSFNKKIIKVSEKNRLLKNFKDAIQGYTYYEN